MIHCPHCQGDVEQDFGLVQCPQCAKNLFIHVDGSVELPTENPTEFESGTKSEIESEMESEIESEIESKVGAKSEVERETEMEAKTKGESSYEFQEEPLSLAESEETEAKSKLEMESATEEPATGWAIETAEGTKTIETTEGESKMTSKTETGMETGTESESKKEMEEEPETKVEIETETEIESEGIITSPNASPQETEPLEEKAPPLLEEKEESIENLASVEAKIKMEAQSKVGSTSLSYNLVIKGIDHTDLQEKITFALSSVYSEAELETLFQKKLSNGTLTLTSLYPLQASLLLQQLKELPLDLDWQQVYKYK